MPGSRRRAREAALQVLFAADLSGTLEPVGVREACDELIRDLELPARSLERAREIVSGVASHAKAIDEAIGAVSSCWRLDRMGGVERNILRVAAFELLFEPTTPVEVVLDEAIEIARRFGGEASPGFVNGVLDPLARQRERLLCSCAPVAVEEE
ncbi:MAG: transcription antitermination factor NusB [Myxococcota bacterium]